MSDGIIHREELQKFNVTYLAAAPDIYASKFTPKKGVSRFRITMCMSTAGVPKLTVYNGTTTDTELLNSGTALVADAVYAWDVPVTSDYSYNLQYSVNGTIRRIQIDEVVQES